MNISPATYGLNALQQGFRKLDHAAQRIASDSLPAKEASASPPAGLTRPLVELKESEIQAKAGIKVIEAEDRAIGSLLDERA